MFKKNGLALSSFLIMCHPASSEETNADALKNLPETYITATKNPTTWLLTPGSGIQLARDSFIQRGGSDLGDVARYDPTISAPFNFASSDGTFGYGQTGYSGYNIRGIEGNRILLLVDGIRQPEQFISTSFTQDEGSEGGAGRDYYDPAMFETTEILKGSASALYGSDALGGVVAFRTPDPDDFLQNSDNNYAGMLRGQHFSHNDSFAKQAFYAFRQNDFSMLLGYAGRTGHETENNGHTAPNPSTFNSDNYLLKLDWEANSEHRFGFTYEYFKRERDLEILSATGFINIFDKKILNWETQQRSRYSLSWDYTPPSSPWYDSIESLFYFQNTENNSSNHSESTFGRIRDQDISFTTRSTGLQSNLRKDLGKHQLTYGLDFSLSTSENRFFREDNGLLPPLANLVSFAPSETLRGALFLQDQFSPSEDSPWIIIGGLRLDYYQISPNLTDEYLERINKINLSTSQILPAEDHEILTITPKLEVIYKLNEETSVYAQYSRGIRNPTAEEISMIFDHPTSNGNPAGNITIPNTSLEEEKSHAFELGYKHQSNHKRLHATAFYTHYSNFIENAVDTGEDSYDGKDILTTMNRGRVDIYGFEVGSSWQLGHYQNALDGFEVGFSTGRTWGIDREEDKWLNSIEPWKSVAWLGYTSPEETAGVRLTGTYVGSVKHIDDSNGELFLPPSYFSLDVSGFWKINDNLTLQAGINNILDEQYWQWSSTRRNGGHSSNASSVDDRNTAPGMNGFISLTYQF